MVLVGGLEEVELTLKEEVWQVVDERRTKRALVGSALQPSCSKFIAQNSFLRQK